MDLEPDEIEIQNLKSKSPEEIQKVVSTVGLMYLAVFFFGPYTFCLYE